MRLLTLSIGLAGLVLGGCAVILPLVGTVDEPRSFEQAEDPYSRDMRFGLYDDAKAFVEPALRIRFEDALGRLREVRFRDSRTTSIELDPLGAHATASAILRGHWLSSPDERELEVTKRRRRELPKKRRILLAASGGA